jgi:hypothetical protein
MGGRVVGRSPEPAAVVAAKRDAVCPERGVGPDWRISATRRSNRRSVRKAEACLWWFRRLAPVADSVYPMRASASGLNGCPFLMPRLGNMPIIAKSFSCTGSSFTTVERSSK